MESKNATPAQMAKKISALEKRCDKLQDTIAKVMQLMREGKQPPKSKPNGGQQKQKQPPKTPKAKVNIKFTISADETHAVVGDHARKIYSSNKGRYFKYDGQTIYINK